MVVYIGGQIKEECRGDLAVVVCAREGPKYDAFLYPVNSEEFVHLTGVRAVKSPPIRTYVGVNHSAGESLVRRVADIHSDTNRIRELDNLVVNSFFLARTPSQERVQPSL